MYDLILRNIGRFIHLNAAEEAFFISLLNVQHLPKKEFLVREGFRTRHQYFVNKGCLRTYFCGRDGLEHNVQFSPEDWWTGDMYSLLQRKPARFNVVALEDSELLSIFQDDLDALYIRIPKFERYFRHLLQNAFVALQERILSSMSETASERYLHFRKKYPHLDKRIPQHQIASYLGITPESLSRVRRQMMQGKK
jgi:CRP-like cAMP-binding protein